MSLIGTTASLLYFTLPKRGHLFSWQSPSELETPALWEVRDSRAGSSLPPEAPSLKTLLYCFLFWTPHPHPEDLSFALQQSHCAPGRLCPQLLPPPGRGGGALCKERGGAGVGDLGGGLFPIWEPQQTRQGRQVTHRPRLCGSPPAPPVAAQKGPGPSCSCGCGRALGGHLCKLQGWHQERWGVCQRSGSSSVASFQPSS